MRKPILAKIITSVVSAALMYISLSFGGVYAAISMFVGISAGAVFVLIYVFALAKDNH